MANLAVTRAALALSDERTRKGAGWALVCVLSPLILLAALLCSLGSGASSHNVSVVEWCFHGGALPPGIPEEYAAHMEDMRGSFALLDACIADIQEMAEGENGLDDIRIKAIFYALYFGADSPSGEDHRRFADCFVSYEERTRIVTSVNEEGEEISAEEIYTVAVPIEDLAEIYQKIGTVMGLAATDEQKANADSIYNLIRYGTAGGAGLGGSDAPFIGADGFCSPVGENWRSIITSEFGYRKDPFTGKTKGHGGMDLAVPTGTSVRAALPGTVTVSQYSSSYGYYVMIDHGGGLATLYAHNSKLLVKVGQTVEAGDIVSLSPASASFDRYKNFEVRGRHYKDLVMAL